jgi:hypothetical protein
MHGFNQRVTGLLQLLKEGEREEAIAKLDPAMAKRLEERRKKEKGVPGEGGIKAGSTPSEKGARHSGVPDKDPATALLESAGKYHIQKDPAGGDA